MDKNRELIIETIKIAESNMRNLAGGPFGAIVVKDGQVIAKAANTVTTTNDPTAHAEVNAIRQAAEKLETFDLTGCEIYASCEPCPMCLSAIYWARIDRIYYSGSRFDAENAGFDDSFIYEELDRPIAQRKVKMIQLLPEEGKELLDQWIKLAGKVKY